MKEVLGTIQDKKKKSAIPLTSQPSRGEAGSSSLLRRLSLSKLSSDKSILSLLRRREMKPRGKSLTPRSSM